MENVQDGRIQDMEARLRGLILHNDPSSDSNAFPRLNGTQHHQSNVAQAQPGLPQAFQQSPQSRQQVSRQNGQPRQQTTPQGRQQKFKKWEDWRQEVQTNNVSLRQEQPMQFRVAQRQPQNFSQNGQPQSHQTAFRPPHQPQQPQNGFQNRQQNYTSRPASQYTPLAPPNQSYRQAALVQSQFLDAQYERVKAEIHMSQDEFISKDSFRQYLERSLQTNPELSSSSAPPVILAPFGSLASGFGMPGSDMDLVLAASDIGPDLPRMIEKIILDMHHGAHLLTRTRVPIIKICEKPSTELYSALCEERQKWDNMTPEEKDRHDHPEKYREEIEAEKARAAEELKLQRASEESTLSADPNLSHSARQQQNTNPAASASNGSTSGASADAQHVNGNTQNGNDNPAVANNIADKDKKRKTWLRERKLGPLDFPKGGVGIQCDINFSNNLGLHNTTLLRCYSLCDPRVRPMVLFVKSWASRRKVNSARDGTLSSYGWVLMVLHYLVNVAQPPVCPNLQLVRRQPDGASVVICDGYDVQFWRNEPEIQQLAAKKMLTHNQQTLGALLKDFFHYYAQQGYSSPRGGFVWTQDVLSLRSPGGVLSKEEKGWTASRRTMVHGVEVRNSYLFAVEDPFELDHNVGRTVTHSGICAIRDEFRRALRILQTIGRAGGEVATRDGELMEVLVEHVPVDEDEKKSAKVEGEAPVDVPASQTVAGSMPIFQAGGAWTDDRRVPVHEDEKEDVTVEGDLDGRGHPIPVGTEILAGGGAWIDRA